MTTFNAREPYSEKELLDLYPKNLKLQLVQVLLRHGERTPVHSRFLNAGLSPYWPYCNAATRISSVSMTAIDPPSWDNLKWRRRLETFGKNDAPVLSSGPGGEVDAICLPGELTDRGRASTFGLGQRLRHLYVDQLGYMPKIISDTNMIYLRATPMPRALESLQQTFLGMYPPSARTASFSPPTIITRTGQEETLYPNEECRRFLQLTKAYGQRTADRWNGTEEMKYLSSLLSTWMPDGRVAVDSHPRLTGILDTVNSTLAHGPQTRLPSKFYDDKGLYIMEKIGCEEWFSGYQENEEYRKVGIGPLVGDIVGRMLGAMESNGGSKNLGAANAGVEEGDKVRFALSGCHDTTLAGLLSSYGAFDNKWPPYTSHISIELFREAHVKAEKMSNPPEKTNSLEFKFLLSPFFQKYSLPGTAPEPLTNKPLASMTSLERQKLSGHFVRVRYNDQPIVIPGCKPPGKHLDGDETFCTLEAFKSISDKFTPWNWAEACVKSEKSPFPKEIERAGYE